MCRYRPTQLLCKHYLLFAICVITKLIVNIYAEYTLYLFQFVCLSALGSRDMFCRSRLLDFLNLNFPQPFPQCSATCILGRRIVLLSSTLNSNTSLTKVLCKKYSARIV